MNHPAVFFDRDGVVNVSPGAGYVLRVEDFHLSPGIIDALRLCKERGYKTLLVTSQQGVGKGLMTQADLDAIHAAMQARLQEQGAAFDGIYACTDLAGTGNRRKPSPVMIHEGEHDHGIDLSRSWIVGDHDRDIQMGLNAGIPHAHTIRIESDKPIQLEPGRILPDTTRLASELDTALLRMR
jgi:histidinol-phosphate phosphatase family protein